MTFPVSFFFIGKIGKKRHQLKTEVLARMKTNALLAILIVIFKNSSAFPTSEEGGKGILDGLTTPGASTTTAKPGGLNALPGGLSAVSNSGPMLILGGFQAIVTKFDPSLVQGLPGLAGLPQMPAIG